MDASEVRLVYLHPRELRERRDACPLAWLPLGTIEWHGRHLPLGLDGLNAEWMCVRAAQAIGGVVVPTQYFGDHRGVLTEAIYAPGIRNIEATFDHRVDCCRELGVSVQGIAANARREHRSRAGAGHVDSLERVYWMLRAYGFTRIVALSGHGPNLRPAQIAADRFHRKQSACRVICERAGSFGEGGGDHAGAFETSLALAQQPAWCTWSASRVTARRSLSASAVSIRDMPRPREARQASMPSRRACAPGWERFLGRRRWATPMRMGLRVSGWTSSSQRPLRHSGPSGLSGRLATPRRRLPPEQLNRPERLLAIAPGSDMKTTRAPGGSTSRQVGA